MPSNPSRAAFTAARTRHQCALEAMAPGEVIIGGETYSCAVTLGSYEPKLQDDGINERIGQDVTFQIDKTILPTAPEPRTEVTVNGAVYRVVNSGAQNDYETAWRITARRYA